MATVDSSSATRITGLASGLDWQSTVEQLIAAERKSELPYTTQADKLSSKLESLDKVKAKLTALQTAANSLKSETSDYYARVTTLDGNTASASSNLTASADGTTPLGSYTFDIVQKATATSVTGTKIGASLSNASQTLENLSIATQINFEEADDDGNKFGKFTVNGASITVKPTDTLQDILTSISTATKGAVTAELSNDKIVLTSNTAGQRITLGSAADTSNFLEAMYLYTDTGEVPATTVSSASTLGAANVNTALSNAIDIGSLKNLTDGKGVFEINGVKFTYSTTSDSIRSLMNEVNNSSAGVLMNYDTGTGQLTILNKETGSTGVSLGDSTGILAMLKLTSDAGATTVYGKNAQFKLNGSSTVLTSNSNTLTSEITGVSGLKVTIKDVGKDTVNVEADSSAAKAKITTFISAYNEMYDQIASETKITINSNNTVTMGNLGNNLEVNNWLDDLRAKLFTKTNSGVDEVSSLTNIGIDLDYQSGHISITDQSAYEEAFEENPNALSAIFNNSTDGIAKSMYDYIENIVKSGGQYEVQKKNINDQIDDIQKTVERMETIITQHQAAYYESFQNMETQQSKLNRYLTIIQSVLGTGSSS